MSGICHTIIPVFGGEDCVPYQLVVFSLNWSHCELYNDKGGRGCEGGVDKRKSAVISKSRRSLAAKALSTQW